jgi:hypothetical protein
VDQTSGGAAGRFRSRGGEGQHGKRTLTNLGPV